MQTNENRFLTKRGPAAFVLCAAFLLLGGCAERKAHAFPWATAVLARPLPPVAHSDNAVGAAAEIDPNFRVEAPVSALRIFSVRPAPPRPRAAPAAAEPATPTKSADLVPELSPQETATAKEQVAASIVVSERNMATARRKNLSPAQADVLAKIAGFLTEAREAGGEGDWARARNLAKKAQILSEDLVASQ